ncbi:transmembrane protein 265-like [Lepisosteus oculatus]|uniref:transmembrane protein 265-like n=1 Tax=Lepisosteus oculatus TaxID=7918 RepID=UPI003713B211
MAPALPNGKAANEEMVPLDTVPGTTGGLRVSSRDVSSHAVKDYRALAIASIICGLSCLGVLALISSVKVRERRERDPESAQVHSRRARNYSAAALAALVGLIALALVLMALVSYLLTLVN